MTPPAISTRPRPTLSARAMAMLAPDADEFARIAALPDPMAVLERLPLISDIGNLEAALVGVWADLTEARARDYLAALRPPVLSLARDIPPLWSPSYPSENTSERPPVGRYQLGKELGRGGTGRAFAARHLDSGELVTLKLCAGSEGTVAAWLGDRQPPEFLKVISWGVEQTAYGRQPWVAREAAIETFSDYLNRRRGPRLPIRSALAIFTIACRGVAKLHASSIYRWSAHGRNIFRVGDRWRLGDLGRCVVATAADDPRFLTAIGAADASPVSRAALLDRHSTGPWVASGSSGFMARDPELERRLRLDDCATLAGLLLDVLGTHRWAIFSQAIAAPRPCQAVYGITGDPRRDRRLSRVLNRAWRGDGGGALAVAAGDRDHGYADAIELLADVVDALERRARRRA